MSAAAARAWYAYCVVPPAAAAVRCAAILPDARIATVSAGGVAVLASPVPRALFDCDDAAHRTADPDWTAARAQAHHAVNVAASAAGPCLPLPFATLYSGLDPLRDFFAPRAAALAAALDRIADHAEWSLSLAEDAAAHAAWLERTDPILRDLAAAVRAAGEGTAFLLARRMDKARAAARLAHLERIAATLGAWLGVGPGAGQGGAGQGGAGQGGAGQGGASGAGAAGMLVLAEAARALPAWTVLAPRAAELAGMLDPLARDLAPAGLTLRLTGPWPAYAFARAALAVPAHGVPDLAAAAGFTRAAAEGAAAGAAGTGTARHV